MVASSASWSFPHCFAEEHVLKSLGPIEHEGPAASRLQKGGTCQAMTTAAFTSSCQGTIACHHHTAWKLGLGLNEVMLDDLVAAH